MHENWQGAFYPEDLPEEWRLDYYSNFSDLIVVPDSIWQDWGKSQQEVQSNADFEAFSDALMDDSQVILVLDDRAEQDPAVHLSQLKVLASELQEVLYGLVVKSDLEVFEKHARLVEDLQTLFADLAVTWVFDKSDDERAFAETLKKLSQSFSRDSAPLWYACFDLHCCLGSPLAWIDSLSDDGKQQAKLLQAFVNDLPADFEGAPVVIAGDSIDIKQVQNLKIVSELLGF